MHLRVLVAFLAGVVAVALPLGSWILLREPTDEQTLVHVLDQPLVVRSPSGTGVLPPSTTLRHLRRYPEGFDRYCVLVNVERTPLPLEEETPPGAASPLAAVPRLDAPGDDHRLSPDALLSLLRSVGATREDLELVLESYDR